MMKNTSERGLLRVLTMLEELSPEHAVSAAIRLMKADPGSDASHFAMGLAARRSGTLEVALGALRNAGRLNRTSALIARVLGETFLHADEPDLAAVAFKASLKRAPNDVEAGVGLAVCHATSGDVDTARALLIRLLAAHPEHPVAALYMGLILDAEGHTAKAIPWFRVSVQSNPSSAAAWVHLGRSLADLGDTEGAQQAYESALNLVPNHPEARQGLQSLAQHH